MQPMYFVVGSFGFCLWDISQNHGAWLQSTFGFLHHGFRAMGLT